MAGTSRTLVDTKHRHARSKDGMPWFNVVHCDRCGHVYGVLAKHVFGKGGGPQLVLRDRD